MAEDRGRMGWQKRLLLRMVNPLPPLPHHQLPNQADLSQRAQFYATSIKDKHMTRKWTDDQVSEAMKQDPLRDAEQITGRSYKTDRGVILLGMQLAMRKHDAEERMLTDADDVRSGMTLSEYCGVVERLGYRQVLSVPFEGKDYSDELQVWWQASRGLLLVFDTYFGKKSVNSGHVYYNWRPSPNTRQYELTSSGTSTKDGVWYGNHDCRKALRINMDLLAANGDFVVPWVAQPLVWLFHYSDLPRNVNWRDKDEIIRRVRPERIAMLPEHVRQATGLSVIA
jgi:hypothetical protein